MSFDTLSRGKEKLKIGQSIVLRDLPHTPYSSLPTVSFLSSDYHLENHEAHFYHASQFITQQTINKIYNDLFSLLLEWKNSLPEKNKFMANALFKYAHDYLFNIIQKYEIVKNILLIFNINKLIITKQENTSNLRYPYLWEFLPELFPEIVQVTTIENQQKNSPEKSHKNYVNNCANYVRLAINKLIKTDDKKKMVIWSDLERLGDLHRYLYDKEVLFVREEIPESLLFQLYKRKWKNHRWQDFTPYTAYKFVLENVIEFDDTLPSIQYKKCNLQSLLVRNLNTLIAKNKNDMIYLANRIYNLCAVYKNQLHAFLVDEDKSWQKNMVIQIAQQFSIPTFVNINGEIQHVIGALPQTADTICLWGVHQKYFLEKYNVDTSRIKIIGATKYEKYLPVERSIIRKKIIQDFRFDEKKPIAVIVPWSLKPRRDILEAVIRKKQKDIVHLLLKKYPHVNYIMKLHPSDTSHEDWKSFCEIYRYKVHIRQSYNPMWLAAGADILIVYQSTFALDGLAFNTPVIITSECQIDKYFSLPWFRDGTTDKKLCESMDYILRVGNLDSTEYYTALKRCLHKEQLYPRMHYGKKSSAQLAELLKGQYTQ